MLFKSTAEWNSAIVEAYSDAGFENFGEAEANYEMVADFVGDCLFGKSNTLTQQLLQCVPDSGHKGFIESVKSFFAKIKQLFSKDKKLNSELAELEKRFIEAYKSAEKNKNTAEDGGGVKYSITESFTDNNGNRYDNAVLLDTDFFNGLSPRNWGSKLKEYVYDRSENNPIIMPIIDENGEVQQLQFAKKGERVSKNNGYEHLVLNELIRTEDNISKLSTVHIDEIIEVSEESNPYYSSDNLHGWLDKNGWLHRNANVINAKNGNIYNVTIDIAKTEDGRTVLYATKGKIKKVGQTKVNSLKLRGSTSHSNFDNSIHPKPDTVNTNYMQNKESYSLPVLEREENVSAEEKEITANSDDLFDRYDRGEISREELIEGITKQKRQKETPKTIADLTEEDANTTPPLERRKGESKGDKESKFYGSLLESDIFDERFKAEVENDSFIKKYTYVTNKETLKKAAKELDEGGWKFRL